jgi:3-dehydroquinate synthase
MPGSRREIVLPAGEPSKRFETLQDVVYRILDARLERGDAVIALGGGVIGDLAGFAAAVVRRGMQFVQMPTTPAGAGRFLGRRQDRHQRAARQEPDRRLLPAAPGARRHGALDTLPKREFRAGYAEVVKYGLIDRPDFFSWLEENWPKIEAGGPERIHAIAESCRAKADVVARDEREAGDRALLNLGHTFGHALEAAAKYDPRDPRSWRGRRHRPGAGASVLRPHEPGQPRRCASASPRILKRRACRQISMP